VYDFAEGSREMRELLGGKGAGIAEMTRILGPELFPHTMIELPRACFIADRIAQHADFFSFGTNDLTQCGIGFSRDDIEGRIIPRYVGEKIVDGSPFRLPIARVAAAQAAIAAPRQQ
jgi:pyruvate, orthophosphate dikinase